MQSLSFTELAVTTEDLPTRAGIISFDALATVHFWGKTPQEFLKQCLVLYDEIWIPWLGKSFPSPEDIVTWDLQENEEQYASIRWLADQGLVKEPPFDIGPRAFRKDKVTAALTRIHDDAVSAGTQTYRTQEEAAREVFAATLNIDMSLSHLTAYLWARETDRLAYPIVSPFQGRADWSRELRRTHEVLSIVLPRLPMPSPKLPLEDFVSFKKDSDTRYKSAKFWQWTRKVASGEVKRRELEEEIADTILDYEYHLKHLDKAISNERLEVWAKTPASLLEDLLKLRLGNLAERFFALRRVKIQAHSEELKLPGQELAYITRASKFLSRARRE